MRFSFQGSTRAFPPHHPLIPVDYQLTGQPVLIGGTMGTCSYVLTGTEHGMTETFGSTCHGAVSITISHHCILSVIYIWFHSSLCVVPSCVYGKETHGTLDLPWTSNKFYLVCYWTLGQCCVVLAPVNLSVPVIWSTNSMWLYLGAPGPQLMEECPSAQLWTLMKLHALCHAM